MQRPKKIRMALYLYDRVTKVFKAAVRNNSGFMGMCGSYVEFYWDKFNSKLINSGESRRLIQYFKEVIKVSREYAYNRMKVNLVYSRADEIGELMGYLSVG